MITNDTNGPFYKQIYNHVILGLSSEIEDHEQKDKNFVEKAGDIGLWPLENFPRVVRWLCSQAKDPKVVTLALGILALIANSYLFYPLTTHLVLKASWSFTVSLIPQIPLWAAKFAAYIFSCQVIVSAVARAEGRFLNKELMDKFNQTNIVSA